MVTNGGDGVGDGVGQARADADRLAANKELVADFCETFYNAKDFARAATLLADDFHNHHHGAGIGPARTVDSFREQVSDRFPGFSLEIRRAVAEGDLVWTYGLVRFDEGAPVAATVDIWRVADGKLAEKWDVGQAVTEETDPGTLM
ncbi:nuclear transport factor 2 family protein [Saccharothrix syringae]|uniref:nuclear transport factor 2 family protein n=1 Tax=Saccharothrix syringae TaxID=103733 RepID=UPI00068CFC8C|nr:nuclear transport factor 2 family protein [Saccharothrix syringae]